MPFTFIACMAQQLSFQGFGSDRLPPQNIEVEEAILGGILLDPEAISRVSDRLLADAFYISAHKDIYQAALKLHSQGKPTDLLSLHWGQNQVGTVSGSHCVSCQY